MTPGLRKDTRCHEWHTLFCVCKSPKSDIRPDVKWTVSLVILGGHFNIPHRGLCGYPWVITLYHPRRSHTIEDLKIILEVEITVHTYILLPHVLR